MISGLLASPWLLAATGFRLLGLLLLITSLVALFRVRPFWFLLRLMAGLVAMTVSVFARGGRPWHGGLPGADARGSGCSGAT